MVSNAKRNVERCCSCVDEKDIWHYCGEDKERIGYQIVEWIYLDIPNRCIYGLEFIVLGYEI